MKYHKLSFSKLLNNQFVLGFVFILSLLTFFGNLIYGNFDAVIYFVLLGGLTSFFTKNMVIVLLIPLLLVNIHTRFIQSKRSKEGMDNNGSQSEGSENNKLTDKQKIELMKKKNANSVNSTTNNSLPIIGNTPENETSTSTLEEEPSSSSSLEEESFSNNRDLNQNKKKKYNIDYASTVEEAYDNLNQVIGGEGIKNLTDDTQRLMKQQLQLTEAMKNIGPLMESMGPLLGQANTLLKSFGGSENLKGLNDLAKNLSAK